MITMSTRLFLFLAVLCASSIATIHGVPIAGSAENKRHERLQHLKEQFELFKKELEQVLSEGPSSPVEAIAAPVKDAQDDRSCDCDDSSSQKRCPNGCGKKSKTASEVENEKRCEGCDDSVPGKRCPNGCKSRSKTCYRRCPTCECEGSPSAAAASGPAAIQDSPIMKRLLNVLPVKSQELIQHSGSKKEFIDRLIRRGQYGPNKEDMQPEKVASPEVSNTEESSAMAAFKRGLNPQQQQMLKNHDSKSHAIQGLLERKAESTDRQLADPVVVEYMKSLSEEDKALVQAHPSSMDDLKDAILLGTHPEEPAAKRGLSSSQIQETINKLANPKDRELVQKHLSKIGSLAVAEKKPAGREEEVSKRKLSPAQIQETLDKLADPSDRELVQKHLSKIEDLAKAENKPVGSAEEASATVARLLNEVRLAQRGGMDMDTLITSVKKRAEASRKPASVKQ